MNFDELKLSSDPAKNEILKCLAQLAERSYELGYMKLSANLFVVAGGSGDDKDEDDLSALLHMYAQLKMAQMKDEANEENKDNA